jgi:4-carboxymuconolactone decarboxylase
MPTDAPLDARTLILVRLAAAVALGDEQGMRQGMDVAVESKLDPAWIDELLLQSILMVGYPRAIVAFGLWRQVSGLEAPLDDADAEYDRVPEWEARGEQVCSTVYGRNYARLRHNVAALHPALDLWMLMEGYGRTLGRPGLELWRRELCTVAQTAALGTPHQLHSHLRGALHAGATAPQVDEALEVVAPLLTPEQRKAVTALWAAVRAGRAEDA